MPTSSDGVPLAIDAVGLAKRYRIGERQPYRALRDTLADGARSSARALARLRRRPGGPAGGDGDELVWALRDVTFEIRTGEVVGIIGRNGAGKSTLLKILSRITEPTEGRARLRGRVGALLEVGTGFHPELTGRENILLNGSILGMGRREIRDKMDEIVAFSEIERYLDTPVKRYSSGMHMRLAFAVAAHLEPEILIVDEVLAVGDAAFQRKCLGKMSSVAQDGRTVMFVSHNMTAVESLCERALWLDAGRVVLDGPPTDVIGRYLSETIDVTTDRLWPDPASAPGNERVRLRLLRVRPEADVAPGDATVKTPLVLEFEYWNLKPGARLNLGIHVYNEQGANIFSALPRDGNPWRGREFPAGLFRDTCRIPGDLLNDGVHSVLLLVSEDDTTPVFRLEDALTFGIGDHPDGRGGWHGKWPGAVRPALEWDTELLASGDPLGIPSEAAELR